MLRPVFLAGRMTGLRLLAFVGVWRDLGLLMGSSVCSSVERLNIWETLGKVRAWTEC